MKRGSKERVSGERDVKKVIYVKIFFVMKAIKER